MESFQSIFLQYVSVSFSVSFWYSNYTYFSWILSHRFMRLCLFFFHFFPLFFSLGNFNWSVVKFTDSSSISNQRILSFQFVYFGCRTTKPNTVVTMCHLNSNELKLNKVKIQSLITAATFLVFNSHIWLVFTVLDSVHNEHFHYCKKFFWTELT